MNDTVEAIVLDLDKANRRISLGLKQIEPNPWAVVAEKYPPGSIVSGIVRNLTDFGAFIELEEGVDGLVHISDMSWTTRIKHPSEVLKKGEEVQAVLLSIDVNNERLSLGVKQLQPNPWEGIADTISVGDNVTGKVVRLTDFGAFIELANGVEGLLHVSEISRQHVKKPEDVLNSGDEITAKVIKLDEDNRRIGLSIKAYEEEVGGGEPEEGSETETAETEIQEPAETQDSSEDGETSAEETVDAPAEEPSDEAAAEEAPDAETVDAPEEEPAADETAAEETTVAESDAAEGNQEVAEGDDKEVAEDDKKAVEADKEVAEADPKDAVAESSDGVAGESETATEESAEADEEKSE
jgi:small subunit ribosomal protein S1